VVVTVQDAEVGVDPQQHKLFRPFVWVAMTRKFGGTGLGLTVAEQ